MWVGNNKSGGKWQIGSVSPRVVPKYLDIDVDLDVIAKLSLIDWSQFHV